MAPVNPVDLIVPLIAGLAIIVAYHAKPEVPEPYKKWIRISLSLLYAVLSILPVVVLALMELGWIGNYFTRALGILAIYTFVVYIASTTVFYAFLFKRTALSKPKKTGVLVISLICFAYWFFWGTQILIIVFYPETTIF